MTATGPPGNPRRVLILSPNSPDFATGLATRLALEPVVTDVVAVAELTGDPKTDLVVAHDGAHIGDALHSAQQRPGLTIVVSPSADAEARIALLDRGCDYVLHGDVPLRWARVARSLPVGTAGLVVVAGVGLAARAVVAA